MESEDYDFYRGLVFLLENNIDQLGYEVTFSTEVSNKNIDIIDNAIIFNILYNLLYSIKLI